MNKKQLTLLLDEIYALAHLLYLVFEEAENTEHDINPNAVSAVARRITVDITKISHWLHDNNNNKPP